MTIDLGFAWGALAGPDDQVEEIGVVDVPGHIDFIKNMLAGIGGIDAVLLVVAADEGVMPQTREHLAIIDLLAIPAGVIVLTKIDAVDDAEWIDLVELDVHALIEGSCLAGAPVVRVSAHTGAGLDALRATLYEALAGLPSRRHRARPRLSVDRVFALTGFGTVVTGTLLDGSLAVGEVVEIAPRGLSARVRGLQTHRRQVMIGQPGSRLAINLGGVEVAEIRRGDVVQRAGSLRPTRLVDARVRVLAAAPGALKHNARVDFFVGASETRGRMRVLGSDSIAPGASGWAQVALEAPIVVAEGDAFILRVPSPSLTVAGGVILDAHPGRKWRRFDGAALLRLQAREKGGSDDRLLEAVRRKPFQSAETAIVESGIEPAAAESALAVLSAERRLVLLTVGGERVLLDLATWDRLCDSMRAALQHYHDEFPLRRGMPRSEARSRLLRVLRTDTLSPRFFGAFVAHLVAEGVIAADDERVWLPDFEVAPNDAQLEAVTHTLAAFAAAPAAPPNRGETLALLGGDLELLDLLVSDGRLVRTGGDVLFEQSAFTRMVDAVVEYLRGHDAITMAEARDLLGSSRKYVQALLEEMDARRLTRRTGDARVLR